MNRMKMNAIINEWAFEYNDRAEGLHGGGTQEAFRRVMVAAFAGRVSEVASLVALAHLSTLMEAADFLPLVDQVG